MFFLVLLAVIGAGTTGIALENLDDEEVIYLQLLSLWLIMILRSLKRLLLNSTTLSLFVQMMLQDGTYAVDPEALRE
jgi:hypothetical protein